MRSDGVYLLLPALCAMFRGGGSSVLSVSGQGSRVPKKRSLSHQESPSAVGGDELPEREVRIRSPRLAPPEGGRLSGCSCAADLRVHEDQFLFITYSKGNRGLSTFVGVS